LSDSFSKVIARAREEYLFVYSVYVLEASTSNRLTHFYPPLNLIPLILIRPLRLFVPADKLRNARIVLLKITHIPIVGAIWLFEKAQDRVTGSGNAFSSIGPSTSQTEFSTQTSAGNPKKQIPFLSKSNTNRSSFHDGPVGDGSHTPSPQTPRASRQSKIDTVVVGSSDLERKVDDLTAKIAELTALIMTQQGTSPEET